VGAHLDRRADGVEGMLDPNTVKDWQAADQIIVETGNAAALTVAHQGLKACWAGAGRLWRERGGALARWMCRWPCPR